MIIGQNVYDSYINDNFIVGFITNYSGKILNCSPSQTRWAKTCVNFLRDWSKYQMGHKFMARPLPFPFGYVPAFPPEGEQLFEKYTYFGHLTSTTDMSKLWKIQPYSGNKDVSNCPESEVVGYITEEMMTNSKDKKHMPEVLAKQCHIHYSEAVSVMKRMIEFYNELELWQLNVLASHRNEEMTRDAIIYELMRYNQQLKIAIKMLTQIHNEKKILQQYEEKEQLKKAVLRVSLATDQVAKKADMFLNGLRPVMKYIEKLKDNKNFGNIAEDTLISLKPGPLSQDLRMLVAFNRSTLLPLAGLLVKLVEKKPISIKFQFQEMGVSVDWSKQAEKMFEPPLIKRYLDVFSCPTLSDWMSKELDVKINIIKDIKREIKDHMLYSYLEKGVIDFHEAEEFDTDSINWMDRECIRCYDIQRC
jgi:hypothetical protein